MANQAINEIREKINSMGNHKRSEYSHSWTNRDSSRCEKCGDKDWMAPSECPVSDQQHEATK